MDNVDLVHYYIIGSRILESGDNLLIDDKFKDDDLALCLLHDDSSGALLLCIIGGILNLDGSTVLLLSSADPEDRESDYKSYLVVRLLSPTSIEVVEKQFLERIQEVARDAIELDRGINLARVESVFGTLRVFDHAKETVPYSK